jgi:hypothetical protein
VSCTISAVASRNRPAQMPCSYPVTMPRFLALTAIVLVLFFAAGTVSAAPLTAGIAATNLESPSAGGPELGAATWHASQSRPLALHSSALSGTRLEAAVILLCGVTVLLVCSRLQTTPARPCEVVSLDAAQLHSPSFGVIRRNTAKGFYGEQHGMASTVASEMRPTLRYYGRSKERARAVASSR